MDGLTLLNKAQSAGLMVEAQGDRLFIRGPKGAEAVAKELIDRKTAVMAALTLMPKPGGQTSAIVPSATGHFCDSNSKLGKGMLSYDISPITTCPGSVHALCRELRPDGNAEPKPICWAMRKKYREKGKKARLVVNTEFSKTTEFVPWANKSLGRRKNVIAVRILGTGDYYSAEFVQQVRKIVRANPKRKFWGYTKSWTIPEMWAELKKLGEEPNMVLWLSWDRGLATYHGAPSDHSFPWCWLAETDNDLPPEAVDLVWRYDGHLQWNQSLPEMHILGDSVVCPHEDGITETTCAKCGICWKGEKFHAAKVAKLLDKYKE